jgi:hypothetical protein
LTGKSWYEFHRSNNCLPRPFHKAFAMVSTCTRTVSWPQDSTYVNVDREDELEFWALHFHVSLGKLKQAVRTVGPKYKDIAAHLNDRR